ncbi:cytochrome P450 CYP82D47-like [Cicer arietinum]|uniref:Cytochrome P450 CYP82D47-like n=1 Tax=Cicer arietinum TaxID=3827 RepID=A0A1S2YHZ3_CICAR|nr:cytochrome P450 CYP82D47-like [Cicer arietinum]
MDMNNIPSLPGVVAVTICATLLFIFILFRLRRSNSHGVATKTPPPEAGGAWPLIGHLHLLSVSQPPHVTLGNMAEKYGPIFTVRLGVHKTLVVSSSEIAKQCFTVNDGALASRPNSVAFEILGYNYAMFGFSPYGSYWRTMRKIATVHVLSAQQIDKLKHVMESEVKEAVKNSYSFWLKLKNEGNSERAITEMKKWFGNIALNVMFKTVMGKRFDGDEEENQRIRKALRDFFDLHGSFVISDTMPFLRWLDLDGREKEMKKTAKELDEFVSVWLDQHKRNKNPSGEQDFMDVLLSAVDDKDLDGRDADTAIKATCLALILAGTDPATGTLTWTLSLLLNNQEVLNKAIQELDTQIGKENMTKESDLTKLEYLQAIVKETLRLYPPSPLNIPHESIEDCTIGGYHVPAGTRLLTNISKLQRDPILYFDPLEFRPERFLTTHKDIDVKGQHFELIPFGAGRRICPGISFGLELMQITLANLLQGFDIMTPNGESIDMVEQSGLTNIKSSPLQVILTPRLSSQVYDHNFMCKIDKK